MNWHKHQLVAISLASTAVAVLLFAKAVQAFNWPPPDCTSAEGAHLNAMYNRCLNVTYFHGVTTPLGSGPALTGALDDQFIYPNWIPFNRNDNWWLPTPCSNQAAITAAFNSGAAVPACIEDPNYANVFINTIANNLNGNYNCGPPADDPYPSCAATRRLAINSALVVATMLGAKGPSFQGPDIITSYTNGINWAKSPAVFNQWATLVRAYAAAGLVDWNYQTFEFPGHINTTPAETSQDYIFFAYTDVAYPVSNVRFRDSAGNSLWELNRACGNLIGMLQGLEDFAVSASLVAGPGDPIPGVTQLLPGTTYRLDAWTKTNDVPSADPTTLEIAVTSTAPGQPVTPVAQDLVSPIIYSPGGGGFTNNVMANGTTAWHWWWKYHSFSPGYTEPTSFQFQLPAGTPNGTTICFRPYASPEHSAGGVYVGSQFCYEVQSPRYPSVSGQRSDIHAGGGVGACSLAAGAGTILGHASAQSYGDYVVSTPDTITGVRSNGTAPAPDSLKMSGYLTVCRPDLFEVAKRYHDTAPSYTTIPPASGSFDVHGKSGAYYYTGNLTLTAGGPIDGRVTVVVDGDVTIGQDLAAEGVSRVRNQLASLGVIASGRILIPAGVTRVDAFMFANGLIDTCSGGGINCNSILTVNGFLMANTLSLGRLGPLNAQGPVQGEVVALTPQLYLNPPMFFDSATVDISALEGQGEKPPLY